MQNPEDHTGFLAGHSEIELYRHFAATGGGVAGEGFGTFPAMHGNNSSNNFGGLNSYCSSSCASFYPGMMSETTESKAVAASRVLHKEAEKRRRERINSHLDRLRSLLPCTSKTDKATLLSKVVQRVVELKRQAAELPPLENLMVPSETDEFHVYIPSIHNSDENNSVDYVNDNSDQIILKASLCCEDRPDLFADLSQVLSSLNLKTLRAEMSTLGGRIQGVLVVAGDCDKSQRDECVVFLRDALKGVVQRSGSEDRLKRRRRVFDHPNC